MSAARSAWWGVGELNTKAQWRENGNPIGLAVTHAVAERICSQVRP
jgi:hypothetical protein